MQIYIRTQIFLYRLLLLKMHCLFKVDSMFKRLICSYIQKHIIDSTLNQCLKTNFNIDIDTILNQYTGWTI